MKPLLSFLFSIVSRNKRRLISPSTSILVAHSDVTTVVIVETAEIVENAEIVVDVEVTTLDVVVRRVVATLIRDSLLPMKPSLLSNCQVTSVPYLHLQFFNHNR